MMASSRAIILAAAKGGFMFMLFYNAILHACGFRQAILSSSAHPSQVAVSEEGFLHSNESKAQRIPERIIINVTKEVTRTELTQEQLRDIQLQFQEEVRGLSFEDDEAVQKLATEMAESRFQNFEMYSATLDDIFALNDAIDSNSLIDRPTGFGIAADEGQDAANLEAYQELIPHLSRLLSNKTFDEIHLLELQETFELATSDISTLIAKVESGAIAGWEIETMLNKTVNRIQQKDVEGEWHGIDSVVRSEYNWPYACDSFFLTRSSGSLLENDDSRNDEVDKKQNVLEDTARMSDLSLAVTALEKMLESRVSFDSSTNLETQDPRGAGVKGEIYLTKVTSSNTSARDRLLSHLGQENVANQLKELEMEAQRRINVISLKNRLEEEERVENLLAKANRAANTKEEGGQLEKYNPRCVRADEVDYMLLEAIEALFRKTDLRNALISSLVQIKTSNHSCESVILESIDNDEKEIGDCEARLYFELSKQLSELPITSFNSSNKVCIVTDDSEGSNSCRVAASPPLPVYEKSLKTFADTPLFPAFLNGVDDVSDRLAGYSDTIDQVLDYLAGSEATHGSGGVGNNLGRVLMGLLSKISIPDKVLSVWMENKARAGILDTVST